MAASAAALAEKIASVPVRAPTSQQERESLEQLRSDVVREITANPLLQDKETTRSLKLEVDARARLAQLMIPANRGDIIGALLWMYARGDYRHISYLRLLKNPRHADVSGAESIVIPRLVERVVQTIEQRIRQEATRFLEKLLDESSSDPRSDAAELTRRGLWLREGTGPRGTVNKAADSHLPGIGRLMELFRRTNDPVLRGEIAKAVGEWGGAEEAARLFQMLGSAGEELKLQYISAFKKIGGPEAARALCALASEGSERVRIAALNAIEELITGGNEVYGEGPTRHDPPRGRYASHQAPEPGTEEIIKTVAAIYENPQEPASLRRRAEDLLFHSFV